MNKKLTALLLLLVFGITSLNASIRDVVDLLWRAHVNKVTKKIERPAEFGDDGVQIIRPAQTLTISKDGKEFSLTFDQSFKTINLTKSIAAITTDALEQAQKHLDTTLELIRHAQDQGNIVDCDFESLDKFQHRIKNLCIQNLKSEKVGEDVIKEYEKTVIRNLNIINSIGLFEEFSLKENNDYLKAEKAEKSLIIIGVTLTLPIIWKVIKKIKNRTHKSVQQAS